MSVLEYLGICDGDIEQASEQVEDVFEELDLDVDDMYDKFAESIKEYFSWDDPTNSFISCLFDTAASYVETKTNRKVEYYVNGYCSDFNLLSEEETKNYFEEEKT